MNESMQDFINDRKIKKEKIDGQIYLMASPSGEHRDVQGNLNTIFNEYFKRNKRRCRARIDHELYVNENNFYEPDLKILCRENRNDDIPVIVIEVLSKSTYDRDFGIKMKKYSELGINEYWIVDWKNLSVAIYLLTDDKKYEYYKSYVYYSSDSEKEFTKLDEDEKKNVVKEFYTTAFPELAISLQDVFDIFD